MPRMQNLTARLNAKQKREKAVSLRVKGKTWQQIAVEVGYNSPSNACRAVTEYLKSYPSPEADELREIENIKLDYLEQKAHEYMDQRHVMVTASGKVATRDAGILTDSDGRPFFDAKGFPVYAKEEVEDHEPVLRGSKLLLDIAARRHKLNGLDLQVTRIEMDDGSVDKEIEDLVAQMVPDLPQVPAGSNEKVGP